MSNPENPPKVFISYSHDSQEHRLRVYDLLKKLREDGIHCVTDHTVMSPPEGWRAWMQDQITNADFTLVVCTETYRRRAERKEKPGVGLGATWEAALITDEIFRNVTRNERFIPVVFDKDDVAHIPPQLGQVSYYRVDLEDGYELLLRHLTNQPLFEEPPVAKKMRELPPITRRIEPLKPKPESQPVPPLVIVEPPKPQIIHQNFTEDLGSGVKLEMIAVPGGSFLMGPPESVLPSERPQHLVTLSPFYMGKYPVTQAQWKAAMVKNPSNFKGDDLPVESVSWHEAVEFCEAVSKHTGKTYRLPTEAEWEYACRAGSTGKYCFGDNKSSLRKYAWYFGAFGGGVFDGGIFAAKTHPVGQKKPNLWGLYDIHGNVCEWCQDWLGGNYYEECYRQGVVNDPQGPNGGSSRVYRGGSFRHQALGCQSTTRNYGSPDHRSDAIGFRVVAARPPSS